MADAGICSRREADRLIGAGRVRVNDQPAQLGMVVAETDVVTVDGHRIGEHHPEKVVLAYYKPMGITCTVRDRYAGKVLGDVFRYPVRVTYAGRLDRDSEGLLLMTNDGLLIERMMRGSQGHEKEYVVKVDRPVTEEFLRKMGAGLYLKELDRTTRPCHVRKESADSFRIILTQGWNRQIRRMCGELGFRVKELKRIRVLNILLDRLQPGEYREVTGAELRCLYEMCEDRKQKDGRGTTDCEGKKKPGT